MNRITVEVYLPASGQTCEVTMDSDAPLAELTGMIAQAMERLAGDVFRADENVLLCDRQTGAVFDIGMTPDELGLKNGSSVMLI